MANTGKLAKKTFNVNVEFVTAAQVIQWAHQWLWIRLAGRRPVVDLIGAGHWHARHWGLDAGTAVKRDR